MKLYRYLTRIIVMFLAATASLANAQATDENRIGAATFEWVLANCKVGNGPNVGMSVIFAQMVINGSTAEEMAAARVSARERVEKYPSKDMACVDLVTKMDQKR